MESSRVCRSPTLSNRQIRETRGSREWEARTVGDKGGRKDKEKERKQDARKQKEEARKKRDKLPKRKA